MALRQSWRARAALAAVLLSNAVGASAAEPAFPSRPVRMVIPYATGGGVDAAGRFLAQQMAADLKQQVLVDNRPGGATVTGTAAVVGAAPDGHTLLLVSLAVVTNQSLVRNIPYDPVTDLRAVTMVGSSPLVLTVNAGLPVTDISSLIAYARANPGKLNYSTAGVGTTTHLAAELLRLNAGIDITPIAYKGSGPAMTDLVSGQIQMAFSSIAAAQPFVIAGKLRALATTGPKRDPSLPTLPAMAESIPGFNVDLWMMLFAPARTPEPVVQRLNEAARAALRSPQLRGEFQRVGQEATGSTSAEANAFLRAEMAKWTKLVRDARIEAN